MKGEKSGPHYVVGEWYNVQGKKRMLRGFTYCGAASCAGRANNKHSCKGGKIWGPGDNIITACGFTNLVPEYPRWEEPAKSALLPFTMHAAFDLTAIKYEKLRDGESKYEVLAWLKEERTLYNVSSIRQRMRGGNTGFCADCPLCHYFENDDNGGCEECASCCSNLTHGPNCYRVWANYSTTPEGIAILAAEFRRVEKKLREIESGAIKVVNKLDKLIDKGIASIDNNTSEEAQ
jgi:hypothetical protein